MFGPDLEQKTSKKKVFGWLGNLAFLTVCIVTLKWYGLLLAVAFLIAQKSRHLVAILQT